MGLRIVILLTLVALAVSGILFYYSHSTKALRTSYFVPQETQKVAIREDYRCAVKLKSSRALEFIVTVPQKGRLSFSYGIPQDQWDQFAEPCRLTLVTGKRKPETLYSRYLNPFSKKEDRNWHEVELDLSRYEYESIPLVFRLEAKRQDKSAYLSRLKLISPGYEMEKHNVLMITIDTLRRDHVSAYGYKRKTTSELDRLAGKSSLFMKAYCNAPLTVPSVTSMMTSTYFSKHQVADNRSVFDGSTVTLAEVLKNNGFTTAAFIGNTALKPNRGLDAGFDVYNAFLPGMEINRRLPERDAFRLSTAATAWLHGHANERFFLWVHYQDPHAPYMPPEPYAQLFDLSSASGASLPVVPLPEQPGGIPAYALLKDVFDPQVYVSRYDAEIHFADMNIGKLLRVLEERKIRDRTIIVVVSDHGESLGEENHYFAHGHNLTSDLTDVPLIVFVPGKSPARYEYPVESIDIAPTLLTLLNIRVPARFRGKFLFHADFDRKVITEQPDVRWAVIHDKGRYIYERTGEERYLGEPAEGGEKGIIQEWIAGNLVDGAVFAFSGASFLGSVIQSDRPVIRAFLFSGEESDRIEISEQTIRLKFEAQGDDVDYVFVQPHEEGNLSAQGYQLQDIQGKAISSPFVLHDIREYKDLPLRKNFSSQGAIIVRKAGKPKTLQLSPEEQEELAGIGEEIRTED